MRRRITQRRSLPEYLTYLQRQEKNLHYLNNKNNSLGWFKPEIRVPSLTHRKKKKV